MVSKQANKYVVWPIYFDKKVSRLQGRKIPKKYAVEKPRVEDIAKAAKALGLHPVLEKNSAHPSSHWKKKGRVLVDKKDGKTSILRQIAKKL